MELNELVKVLQSEVKVNLSYAFSTSPYRCTIHIGTQ